MTFAIFLIIIIFMVGVQASIPFLMKKTVVFGVSVPEAHRYDNTLIGYKKTYSFLTLMISITSAAAYVIWYLNGNPGEAQLVLFGSLIEFGIIFISMALYFYFHAKTTQFKRNQNWDEDVKQVKIIDLNVRTQDEMLPWYVYILPIAVTLGVIGYTLANYANLPEQIPTHWGPDGKADSFAEKNPFSVISLPLIILIIQFMFLGMVEATKRSGIKLSAANTEGSKVRQLASRKYTSWFMFMMAVAITMLFSFLQLNTIHPNMFSHSLLIAAPLIFLGVTLIGTIIYAVKVGNAGEKITGQPLGGMSDYNDDQYWKGGLFYFNKNDPSIFVEKRFGIGWTINFANPRGYLLVFVPLIIIILLSFL